MVVSNEAEKAIQGFSVKDPKRINQRIVDLNSSGFEKGDTARRSRTTDVAS